jgi:hypothetical protein
MPLRRDAVSYSNYVLIDLLRAKLGSFRLWAYRQYVRTDTVLYLRIFEATHLTFKQLQSHSQRRHKQIQVAWNSPVPYPQSSQVLDILPLLRSNAAARQGQGLSGCASPCSDEVLVIPWPHGPRLELMSACAKEPLGHADSSRTQWIGRHEKALIDMPVSSWI